METLHIPKSYMERLVNDIMLLNRGNRIQKLIKSDPPNGIHIKDFYRTLLILLNKEHVLEKDEKRRI